MYCVVKNCKSVWKPDSNIIFHSFPKDPEKQNTWLSIIPIKGKFCSSAKICSLHFKQEDYNPKRPKHLLNSAVPFYLPHSCDCISIATEACSIPSISETQPNIGSVSVNTDTMCIKTLKHESKENLLFTALTSSSTVSSHQVPQPGSSQLDINEDAEYEPPTKRPCLKDFNVLAKMKTPREIYLEKNKKILQQKVTRQQEKINNMESLISIRTTGGR